MLATVDMPACSLSPRAPAVFCVRGPVAAGGPPPPSLRWLLDVALFLALLCAGTLWLAGRGELSGAVFGELLANAGLTPLLLALWSLAQGAPAFRRQHAAKAGSGLLVLLAGLRLLGAAGPLDAGAVLAPALTELGVVFFISKLFFMSEDAELQVERLEQQLAAAKRSPGVGLALSYYFNFVAPTAAGLAARVIGTPLEMAGNNHAATRLGRGSKLFVLVPRDLEGDVKSELRALGCAQGRAKMGKEGPHRPMFLFFLDGDCDSDEVGFAFDIPTVLHSCWMRARAEGKTDSVPREILDFQNELYRLVSTDPATRDKVEIVSIPAGPWTRNQLLHVCSKLDDRP